MNQKMIAFNQSQRRDDLPTLRTGDVVRVTRRIKEGGKERLQLFEGMVIAQKGRQSASPTITVRKVSLGIGVEIIFSLNSSQVEKIEVVKHTTAGRSKLYYVRHKSAKVLSRKLKEVVAKSLSPKVTAKIKKSGVEEGVKEKAEESPLVSE